MVLQTAEPARSSSSSSPPCWPGPVMGASGALCAPNGELVFTGFPAVLCVQQLLESPVSPRTCSRQMWGKASFPFQSSECLACPEPSLEPGAVRNQRLGSACRRSMWSLTFAGFSLLRLGVACFFPCFYMCILFPKLHLQVQLWGSGSCAASSDPAQREPLVSPPLGPKTSAPGQLLLFMGEIIPLSFLQLKGSFRKTTREMSNGEFCLTVVSAILIRSVTTHLDKSTRTQTRCRGEGDEMI